MCLGGGQEISVLHGAEKEVFVAKDILLTYRN